VIHTIYTSGEDYDRRMAAAKARAGWELGDPSWAGVIIGAFLYPLEDAEALEVEQRD
jgi:hypothetical protein